MKTDRIGGLLLLGTRAGDSDEEGFGLAGVHSVRGELRRGAVVDRAEPGAPRPTAGEDAAVDPIL